MIHGLLLDFGGTIDCPPHTPRHWLDRFRVHYREAGIELTRDQLEIGFNFATRAAYRAAATLRNFGLDELVDYLVRIQIEQMRRAGSEATRETLGPIASGFRLDETVAWIAQTFAAEMRRGFSYTREVIALLAERLKLGVVSNFYGNLDYVMQEAGLSEFFDAIVDSSRVGIFKPDLGIYTAALDLLGMSGDVVAMAGDSIAKDCVPARRLGLKTIWVRSPEDSDGSRLRNADFNAADFTIDDLAELEDLNW